MQDERFNPITLIISAFSLSSLAGLASLLRSGSPLTLRRVGGAVLTSGLLGLVILFLWFNYFKNDTWFLLGLCILAGAGGASLLDFLVQILKDKGLTVKIYRGLEDASDDEPK